MKKNAILPIEGQWFEVNPTAIDQSFFIEERDDFDQDETRILILEAFVEVDKHPEKYGKPFKTLMPKKDWFEKSVVQLNELACKLGNHKADWVEQCLEWGQVINNGVSWNVLCNKPDIAKWHRLVLWKDGEERLVGGAGNGQIPASNVDNDICYEDDVLGATVPLVVSYEE